MTTYARVNEIDLLRFIAAVAVVFYHYTFRGFTADSMSMLPFPSLAPVTEYGYLGVELFFMISGFVILMTAGTGNLKSFAISRVVRLYPAFWVCCTITFLVTLWIGSPRFTATLNQYLVNMTMLSEFVHVPSIDGVYWSLFVEMQFYAMVAVILATGQIHRAELLLAMWLVASIALEVVKVYSLRRLLIVEYSPMFIGGAMADLIWAHGASLSRLAIYVLSWALEMVQSIGSHISLEKHYGVSFSTTVIFSLITLFFVVMLLVALKRTGPVGRMNWKFVGALTYPLYLIHQNIGYMIFNELHASFDAYALLVGTIGLSLVIAAAVHFLFEKPIAPRLKAALNYALARVALARSA